MTGNILTGQAINQIFTEARTHNGWLSQPVSEDVLLKAYDLMKFCPTSANCCPLRIVFIKTPEGKARLKPTLMEGNVEKTMAAPVVAILAQDTHFYEHLPFLFPHADAKSWFVGNPPVIAETAMRNSSLQAAYFILAARACGLDCGPMSGFDKDALNREFFPDGRVQANMLCNLGYGDPAKLFPRSPRFAFKEVCSFA
jgi:3-hydroxypropanoate dehydrogenase